MSIVSAIGNVINKMSVASAIDYHIAERNFANLLKFNNNYQVFIDAPLISEGSVNSGVFLRTYQVKMLWLKKMTKGSTYTQHYDNGITPMRTLVKEFVLRLNNEKSNITNAAIFEPVLSVRETDLINLFDENTSGVLIEFNLKVIDDGSICTPNVLPAPSVFIFADQTTVTAGTEIRLGWIAFSVDNITIDNGIGEVSAIGSALVTINNTITYTATATNSSGTATDTITITVSNGCDDATAVLKNTDGTILSTTDIPSGDTQDIIAPDGHVHIKKENDGTIANVFVASGSTELYVVQNNDVEINGVKQGEVHATETVEIDLEDSGGNPVTPTNVTQSGNTFTVELPSSLLAVDFSVDDATPETNQVITFTDLTVGATSWLWDFGDGNLSTLQNPTHTYKTTGTYTVTLCASDGTISGKEVKTNYITVSLEAEVTTDLIASYNANDWVDDGAGNASQWNDSSGNGYHLTNGGAANRPQILTNQLNGFGSLRFNGVNQWLQNSAAGFSVSDCTYYIVFERKRVATEVLLAAFSSANYRGVLTSGAEMAYRLRQVTQGGFVSYGNNVDRYVIGGFRFENVNGAIQFFGLQAYEGIAINPSVAETGLYLCRNGLGGYQQADIVELKVYSAAHNAATMNAVIQRLSAKFNKYE